MRAMSAWCGRTARNGRWLAFTDADTTVADDWLARQLDCCADAVCGVIGVHDWSPHIGAVCEHFGRTYTDVDGHQHIHGANLGVSARVSEGVRLSAAGVGRGLALVDVLMRSGAYIEWSAAQRVLTSARLGVWIFARRRASERRYWR